MGGERRSQRKAQEKTTTKQEPATPQQTPIEYLRPNPWQPRQHINEGQLKVLADTIRRYDFTGYLEARRDPDNPDHLQLVFGHRRCLAAQLAGLTTLPVVIRDYSDKQMAELALLENHTQEQLSYYDEGVAFIRMMEEHGYKIRELCELFGVSLGYITNRVGIARLPEESPLVAAAKSGQADMTSLLTLRYLERDITPDSVKELLEAAVRGDISADQLKLVHKAVKQVNENLQLVDEEHGRLRYTITLEQAKQIDEQERAQRLAQREAREQAYRERTERERTGESTTIDEFTLFGRVTATEGSTEPVEASIDMGELEIIPPDRSEHHWIKTEQAIRPGGEQARWVITQIRLNATHLRKNLVGADFSELDEKEREEWQQIRDEMIALLSHAGTVPSNMVATTSRS